MKSKEKILLASTLVAGAIAFLIANRKKRTPVEKEGYTFFKKNRHLTPAFASFRKHS